MDKLNVMLALALAAVVASAAVLIVMVDDSHGTIKRNDSDGFTLHITGEGGTPETYDWGIAFTSLYPDGKFFRFYDFGAVKAPEGKASVALKVENVSTSYPSIYLMIGEGTMTPQGDGTYKWDKTNALYYKADGKEVYYAEKDSIELVVVPFAGTTVNVNLVWTTDVITATYHPNGATGDDKTVTYANVPGVQCGYLLPQQYTREHYIFKGWSDLPDCLPEYAFGPGTGYFVSMGDTLYAIWAIDPLDPPE
jgi:hypothetical protein